MNLNCSVCLSLVARSLPTSSVGFIFSVSSVCRLSYIPYRTRSIHDPYECSIVRQNAPVNNCPVVKGEVVSYLSERMILTSYYLKERIGVGCCDNYSEARRIIVYGVLIPLCAFLYLTFMTLLDVINSLY